MKVNNADVINNWHRVDAVLVIGGKEYIAHRVMLYVGGRGHVLSYSLFQGNEHVGFIAHDEAAKYVEGERSCL